MLSVSAACRDSASKLAVIAGEQMFTFDQLSVQVQQLAEKINKLVSSRHQPVAFVAKPSLDSLLLFYALLELGQSALPLNPRLLATDHQAMIEQAGAIEISLAGEQLGVTGKAAVISRADGYKWVDGSRKDRKSLEKGPCRRCRIECRPPRLDGRRPLAIVSIAMPYWGSINRDALFARSTSPSAG